MKKLISICAAIMFFGAGYARASTWTTLDYPGARWTEARGISSSNVVGCYGDGWGNSHGFLYNGTSWTTLDYPGAQGTSAFGISGSNIVGAYQDYFDGTRGFLYNDGTWTTLDYPGAFRTEVVGISGSTIVGRYIDSITSGHQLGFLYNDVTWTTLDYPGSQVTYPRGISGSSVIGAYQDNNDEMHGFLYNDGTWTTLGYPGAFNASAIDGNNIINYRQLYNLTTGSLTTLDVPGTINGISGSSVVEYYWDSSDKSHGFIDTIPEPATLLLLGLGAVMLRRKG
jgi:hypothetical protein